MTLVEIAALGILAWIARLWLSQRDLALRGERLDAMAPNEARSLSDSQEKELAELASKYCRE